ncbi:Holliday junction resolvase RuvX [Galactobacter sp.]|uniref:Holliday junction resolvase RuvX n=1 Tax=Galactobacter sp. TaxID=2676125 RepID=UPI00345D3482
MIPRGTRFGVDVGRARVGVSRSDPDGILATPVKTLRRDQKKGTDLAVLTRLAREAEAVVVYVGLPLNLHGQQTPSTEDAQRYARALATTLDDVEVRLVDERLTTVSAQRKLHESGRDVKNSRSVIDQAAAVDILQQALDVERASGRRAGEHVLPPVSEPPTDSSLSTEQATSHPGTRSNPPEGDES